MRMVARDQLNNISMVKIEIDPLSLAAQLSKKDLPPVHHWNPDFCGDIDIRIARDGTWFYTGSPIGRKRLVRLFSTVLRKDKDGEYYLVTPVEKLRIQVDDVPFVANQLEEQGSSENQQLYFRTQTDDIVLAGANNRIWVEHSPSGEPTPYLEVRDGLNALIARNVYYQLIELGIELDTQARRKFGVWSNGEFFELGQIE